MIELLLAVSIDCYKPKLPDVFPDVRDEISYFKYEVYSLHDLVVDGTIHPDGLKTYKEAKKNVEEYIACQKKKVKV